MASTVNQGKEQRAIGQPSYGTIPPQGGPQACVSRMNQQHREIRAMLKGMAPKRAIAWIQSFELPQEEAQCIAECDVRRRSCVEQAFCMNVSVDVVKRCRRRAYRKIADGLNAEKSHT